MSPTRGLQQALFTGAVPRTALGAASRLMHGPPTTFTTSRSIQATTHHVRHPQTAAPLQHHPRAPFSQASALRRQKDSDRLDSNDVNLDAGTSAPTKAALSRAVNDAAAREEGRSGGGLEKQSGRNDKATQSAQDSRQPRGPGSQHQEVPGVVPDGVAEGNARGRTGGGKALDSSSENAPAQPKILNASVPGIGDLKLSKEQKREVDQHNKEFEETFDHAEEAPQDKVDKKFWSEERQRG